LSTVLLTKSLKQKRRVINPSFFEILEHPLCFSSHLYSRVFTL